MCRLLTVARLAGYRHDFLTAVKLDRLAAPVLADPEALREIEASGLRPLRAALLASHTVDHLLPAIRMAGLRRRLALTVAVAPYGQYRQVLLGPSSPLDAFAPQFVLLALDADEAGLHLPLDAVPEIVEAAIARKVEELAALWRRARERFGATVVQQTVLNTACPLFGSYDGLVASAPFTAVEQLNAALRRAAREEGVLLLDLDWHAARRGREHWSDPMRWHQAKQLVSPVRAPAYGDLLARVAAASAGLSRKCLVLDLDNTLWGGVIGDDGLDGIVLGQGSASGEAFLGFQRYCRLLGQRGIVLAVCSKNDERNALEAFEKLPEMALRRGDIAAFVANWNDKATNLRQIAGTLNIGLDSLVFVDDNPAERAIIRQELPMVAVPELPDDVAGYADRIAEAGYFEAAAFTADDAKRGAQYAANAELRRARLDASATDMEGFLRGLEMVAQVRPFDRVDLARVTQLTNKTNQFNLTTRRYTEVDIERFMTDPSVLTLQFRLSDCFGDHGLISVLVARPDANWGADALLIDTWLMSCRVLGRGVEAVALDRLVQAAQTAGKEALIGTYSPTAKNGIVADHYTKLGFDPMPQPCGAPEHATFWRLDLAVYEPRTRFITIQEFAT
jgi:FkbH-like protein